MTFIPFHPRSWYGKKLCSSVIVLGMGFRIGVRVRIRFRVAY